MLLRALVTDHRNLQPKLYIPSIPTKCTYFGQIRLKKKSFMWQSISILFIVLGIYNFAFSCWVWIFQIFDKFLNNC